MKCSENMKNACHATTLYTYFYATLLLKSNLSNTRAFKLTLYHFNNIFTEISYNFLIEIV